MRQKDNCIDGQNGVNPPLNPLGAKKCPSQAGQGPTKGDWRGETPSRFEIIDHKLEKLNPSFGPNRFC